MTEHEQDVFRLARDAGFGLVGIAPAQPSAHATHVRQWLAEQQHGQMAYLQQNIQVRLDPRKLLDGARSIIVVADFYPDQAGQGTQGQQRGRAVGRVARYAWGDDYHKLIKKRLHRLADALRSEHPQAEFKCVTDTAPLLEREHAARAGLGWIGKHTLLLHPRLGSYMLLGAVVTTLELANSAARGYPLATVQPTDHCGTCTRCIDACPTQCIEDPAVTGRRSLDASRCISYLTLEHRSLIDAQLHEPMGDWVAGCDVCQQVCPYNRVQPLRLARAGTDAPSEAGVPAAMHRRYRPRELAGGLDLLEVLGWSAEDRQRVFQSSALKRMKLEMIKRNALIAAGNVLAEREDTALRAKVAELAEDAHEHPLVRDTARQVIERLDHR